ncbi:hypothetical protein [Mycobacterium sp.]|uniref:hypothetical protein n=1 Tax=Mycobacterium sp. TaxID=1785 RepID=UPI003D134893
MRKRQLVGMPGQARIRGGEERISPHINAGDLRVAESGILDVQIFNLRYRPFTSTGWLGGHR